MLYGDDVWDALPVEEESSASFRGMMLDRLDPFEERRNLLLPLWG